ncbi:MAG: iron-containing alcohol dehydrogenase [Clostridia bacterium]|nr:iron-containing alcohol dehydrogenase [Clostridia bacterium]
MADNISLTNYTVGADAYAMLSTICARLGTKLLPIGGKRALTAAYPIMQAALSQGSEVTLLNGFWYGGECSQSHVEVLAKHAESICADIIAGVGGGKAIDTAKAVAQKLNLPCVTLPTVASSCAAVTPTVVMYDNKGRYTETINLSFAPSHCFIDTDTISCAPVEYMRAGMGDTLAKHYEFMFADDSEDASPSVAMAGALSEACVSQLLKYGGQALEDGTAAVESDALDRVVVSNIVTSGYVSTLEGKEYSSSLAHAMCQGLSLLPHVRKNYLQGDLVAYGVLVQLVADGHEGEAAKLYPHLRSWNTPVCLKDIHVTLDWTVLSPLLDEVVTVPSVAQKGISPEKIFEAMGKVEALADAKLEAPAHMAAEDVEEAADEMDFSAMENIVTDSTEEADDEAEITTTFDAFEELADFAAEE